MDSQDLAYERVSAEVLLPLTYTDATTIGDALELLAGIDEDEHTDYDALLRLSAFVRTHIAIAMSEDTEAPETDAERSWEQRQEDSIPVPRAQQEEHVARMERMLSEWREGRNTSPDSRDYVIAGMETLGIDWRERRDEAEALAADLDLNMEELGTLPRISRYVLRHLFVLQRLHDAADEAARAAEIVTLTLDAVDAMELLRNPTPPDVWVRLEPETHPMVQIVSVRGPREQIHFFVMDQWGIGRDVIDALITEQAEGEALNAQNKAAEEAS